MAYRLKADESVADGVKRVILDEIGKAEAMLRQEDEARDAGIHDARKAFKKIRAVLVTAHRVGIFGLRGRCGCE